MRDGNRREYFGFLVEENDGCCRKLRLTPAELNNHIQNNGRKDTRHRICDIFTRTAFLMLKQEKKTE